MAPGLRSVAIISLVLVEILALTIRFDVRTMAGATGWWIGILSQGPLLIRLGITIVVAACLFCGSVVVEELRGAPATAAGYSHIAWLFVCHLAAMLGVGRLTELLLEAGTLTTQIGTVYFFAWVSCGIVATATLALVVLPALAWGRLVRRIWPSLLIAIAVGLVAWGGGLVSERLWEPLGRSTMRLVHAMLGLVCEDIVYAPNDFQIGTKTFGVYIAPQCSGYEGIGLILAFLGGYLWLFQHSLRFPHSFVILPLGAIFVWTANSFRITALILIGTWGSEQVALGGFHSQAGWLAFNAIALGLVLLTHHSGLFARTGVRPPREASQKANLTTAYLIPLLMLVAISMVTVAFAGGFDALYPLRVFGVALVLWYFRRSYPPLRWSWRAVVLVWLYLRSGFP